MAKRQQNRGSCNGLRAKEKTKQNISLIHSLCPKHISRLLSEKQEYKKLMHIYKALITCYFIHNNLDGSYFCIINFSHYNIFFLFFLTCSKISNLFKTLFEKKKKNLFRNALRSRQKKSHLYFL